MDISEYRRFKTRRECRENVNENAETEYCDEDDDQRVSSVIVSMMFDYQIYDARGYAWRNPGDAPNRALAEKIAKGHALKALAAIIWQADTAQAMHKAQAAKEARQRVDSILISFQCDCTKVVEQVRELGKRFAPLVERINVGSTVDFDEGKP